MATAKVDVYITCGACGEELSVPTNCDLDSLTADPCEKCLSAARNEGESAGYDDGYDSGYNDAIKENEE